MFSGANASTRTANVAPKVTMKSGIAQLTGVETYTSNKGSICAKLIFGDVSDLENAEAGHIEYLSTSDGARFGRAFDKLSYLSQHSSNETAIAAFATLPSPVTVLTDGVDENQNPKAIVFETNEELRAIQENHGAETTFVWLDNDSKSKQRLAIKFNNPAGYIAQYVEVMSKFIGENYMLDVAIDPERGFQKLKSINKSKI